MGRNKYRVWDKDLCEYVTGAEFGLARMSIRPDEEDGRIFSFDTLFPGRYTWEQYTNLYDKNGNEICVGDIVSSHNGDVLSQILQSPNGEYRMHHIGVYGGGCSLFPETDFVEVVGNIHENSELLEKK